MARLYIIFLSSIFILTNAVATPLTSETVTSWQAKAKTTSQVRGWEYVMELLKRDGIPHEDLVHIFASKKIPYWTPISFKVKPRESKAMYRRHRTRKARSRAVTCYRRNRAWFDKASKEYNVAKEILTSIIQIETFCGTKMGTERVFYWLSRLVSTGFPPNIEHNVETTKEKPKPSREDFIMRSAWLEKEFLPHVKYLIQYAEALNISPLDVRGSYGGAIGIPQFLPGNVKKFGADGDKNGSIDLNSMPDATHSVANFLKVHGWSNSLKYKDKKKVILNYNKSHAYADTVLHMAQRIKNRLK